MLNISELYSDLPCTIQYIACVSENCLRLQTHQTQQAPRAVSKGLGHISLMSCSMVFACMSLRYPKMSNGANHALDSAELRGRSVGGMSRQRSGRQRGPQSSVGLSAHSRNLKLDGVFGACSRPHNRQSVRVYSCPRLRLVLPGGRAASPRGPRTGCRAAGGRRNKAIGLECPTPTRINELYETTDRLKPR